MTSSPETHTKRPLLGPLLIVCSTFAWVLSDCAGKILLLENIGILVLHLAFLRGLFMVVAGAGMMHYQKQSLTLLQILRHPQLSSGILKGITSFGTTIGVLTAIQTLSLAQAISVLYSAPFIVMLLAPLMVKERFTITHFMCILVGFMGVMIIVNPNVNQSAHEITGYLWIAMSAFFMALFILICRRFKDHDQSLAYCTSGGTYMILAGVGCAFATMGGYTDTPITILANLSPTHLAILIGGGVAGMLAMTLGQTGFSYTPSSISGLIAYSELIWVGIFDYVVFDIIISLQTLVGMVIIVAAGTYGIYKDYKK